MEFRSTNDQGYTHLKGDLVTNVSSGGVQNSSHGVHLTGGSTGGIVQPSGDEASIGLTIRSKGAGPLNIGHASSQGALNLNSTGALTLGTSSTNVTIGSTLVVLGSTTGVTFAGGSTAPFTGFVRTAISSFSTPAANSTNIMTVESTAAFAGVNSSCFFLANSSNLTTSISLTGVKSATGGVRLTFIKTSTLAIATGSTHRMNFMAIRF